jgi:hypothetical protein
MKNAERRMKNEETALAVAPSQFFILRSAFFIHIGRPSLLINHVVLQVAQLELRGQRDQRLAVAEEGCVSLPGALTRGASTPLQIAPTVLARYRGIQR